jgi:hypothetical protein
MSSTSFQQGQRPHICAAMPVGTSIKRRLGLEISTGVGKAEFVRSLVSTVESHSTGQASHSKLGKHGSFVPSHAEWLGKSASRAKITHDSMQTSLKESGDFHMRNGLRGSKSEMTSLARTAVSAAATCTRTTSNRGKTTRNFGRNWTMASHSVSPAIESYIALLENAVKSVKLLTGNAEDNTEPSSGRKALEGVTTRGRAYRRFAPTAVIASKSAAAERHEIVWAMRTDAKTKDTMGHENMLKVSGIEAARPIQQE